MGKSSNVLKGSGKGKETPPQHRQKRCVAIGAVMSGAAGIFPVVTYLATYAFLVIMQV